MNSSRASAVVIVRLTKELAEEGTNRRSVTLAIRWKADALITDSKADDWLLRLGIRALGVLLDYNGVVVLLVLLVRVAVFLIFAVLFRLSFRVLFWVGCRLFRVAVFITVGFVVVLCGVFIFSGFFRLGLIRA